MQDRVVSHREFIEAAWRGGEADLATLNRYIEINRHNVANINLVDGYGSTALIKAAAWDRVAIVRALLSVHGIDINAVDADRYTALVLAACQGYADIVTDFLAMPGIDITKRNCYGRTAAEEAEREGYVDIAAQIRSVNVPVLRAPNVIQHPPVLQEEKAVDGVMPNPILNDVSHHEFMEAARLGGEAGLVTVNRYIEINRHNVANINEVNLSGSTALILASAYNHASIVRALLGVQGIDINAASRNRYTALILAARFGDEAIVTALLAMPGIDITKRNNEGRTAAELADRLGRVAIAARIRSANLPLTFEDRLNQIGFKSSDIDKDFLCPISLCVMDDPITTSSGIAYNRASLADAFLHLGNPRTIKCAINRNHNIKIEELSDLTTVFLKNKIEKFVKKQEKIAQDITEIKDVLSAVITTIETEEASPCSSSVAAPQSDRMRVADLRMRLFSRSIQSHESSNQVGIVPPCQAASINS